MENFEGSKVIEFGHDELFLVTQIDKLIIYSSATFQKQGEIQLELLKSESREPNEIISIQKCQNETYLALLTGKKLIMSENKANQLFIYKKKFDM